MKNILKESSGAQAVFVITFEKVKIALDSRIKCTYIHTHTHTQILHPRIEGSMKLQLF